MSEIARPGLPLDFRVLGPLVVVAGAAAVDLGGLRRQAVLAVLLAAGGTTVSESVVIEALWGDRPAPGARNNLQTHVSRLRAAHPELAPRLLRSGSGYRLHVEPGELDTDRVDALASRARAAERPQDAASWLEQAVAHWRGRPLDEFGDLPGWPGSSLAALQVRLDEQQDALREDLLAAWLAAGRHAEALPDLEQAAARRPDHERGHRLLATALYRSGRAADALEALRRYRRRLVDQSGLDPSVELTALEHQILVQDAGLAGPPRVAGTPRSARTGGPSPVHGREADLALLRAALATAALVTVTGPGGVGKTRLVRELLAVDGPEAAVVLLAPARSAADATAAVAAALDVRAGPGQPLEDAVVDYLGTRPTLLVLDDCEHLLADLARLVDRALVAAPALTVLATSRDVLGVDGEQVLPLAPLPVPAAGSSLPDGELGPAVQLFVDRARRVRPGFVADAGALPVVEELCRRLDGLPLAIELAAGQLGSLGLHDLLDRLDDRLDLLAAPRRTSLREVVDRSYRLLDEPQCRLFARLSVFDGGFTLEAAIAVGSEVGSEVDAGARGGTEVVLALRRLVEASMVAAHDDGSGRLRYSMLETLRAFAAERLRESVTGLETAVARHAAWAAGFVETAEKGLEGPTEGSWAARLAVELPNLRTAWHGSLERGDLATAARMTVALATHAQTHGLSELWSTARRLADDPRLPGDPLFVAVQGAAAHGACLMGELDEAERHVAAGRRAAQAATSTPLRAWWCPAADNIVALYRGDHARAEQLAREALSAADSPLWQTILLGDVVLARLYGGQPAAAEAALPAVVRHAQEVGGLTGLAWASFLQGEVLLVTDPLAAVPPLREAVVRARAVGTVYVEGIAMVSLLSAAVRSGDHGVAVATFPDAVRHWQRSGMWVQQWTTLRLLAELLVDLGVVEPAAVLLGAAAADADAPRVSGPDLERVQTLGAALQRSLGAARAAELHARGGGQTRREVVELALDVALPAAAAALG